MPLSPEHRQYVKDRVEEIQRVVTTAYLDYRNAKVGLSWADKVNLIRSGAAKLKTRVTPDTVLDEAFQWDLSKVVTQREKQHRMRTLQRLHRDCQETLDQAYLGSPAMALTLLKELETRWETLCGGPVSTFSIIARDLIDQSLQESETTT